MRHEVLRDRRLHLAGHLVGVLPDLLRMCRTGIVERHELIRHRRIAATRNGGDADRQCDDERRGFEDHVRLRLDGGEPSGDQLRHVRDLRQDTQLDERLAEAVHGGRRKCAVVGHDRHRGIVGLR